MGEEIVWMVQFSVPNVFAHLARQKKWVKWKSRGCVCWFDYFDFAKSYTIVTIILCLDYLNRYKVCIYVSFIYFFIWNLIIRKYQKLVFQMLCCNLLQLRFNPEITRIPMSIMVLQPIDGSTNVCWISKVSQWLENDMLSTINVVPQNVFFTP